MTFEIYSNIIIPKDTWLPHIKSVYVLFKILPILFKTQDTNEVVSLTDMEPEVLGHDSPLEQGRQHQAHISLSPFISSWYMKSESLFSFGVRFVLLSGGVAIRSGEEGTMGALVPQEMV